MTRILQLGMGWFPRSPGGLNRVFYNLATGLPKLGLETTAVALDAPTSPGIVSAGSSSAWLPLRLLNYRNTVRRLVNENTYSLIVSHFALYTYPVINSIRDIPLVVHFQGPWALESRASGYSRLNSFCKFKVERLVYSKAARFIVLSTEFKQILTEHYSIDGSKVVIIPPCIDTAAFNCNHTKAEARKLLNLDPAKFTLTTIRRLVPRMGLDILLQAIATVTDPHLVIVGDGPLQTQLKELACRLKIDNRITFLGRVADELLPLLYRASDLTIVPSRELEGFGLTTIESLAAGTPVIVSPVGGLPEAVKGLSEDLVLDELSIDAVSKKLHAVISGKITLPDSTKCMTYARQFDSKQIIPRIIDTYKSVE